MTEPSDHVELTFRSIECLMDDGRIDAEELADLIDIAERDGHISDEEKVVLQKIWGIIQSQEIDPDLAGRLNLEARLEVLAALIND